MATHSKVTLGDELRQLENGIKTNLNDVQTLVIDGTTYTIPELLTHVDGFISVQDAATKAKNDFHTAVTAEKASNSAARTFREQMKGFLIARYGKDSPKLAEFGFAPAKPKKTSAETKAAAVAKVKATRAARHTMGKKQKLKIKGTVPPAPQPQGQPNEVPQTQAAPGPVAPAPAVPAAPAVPTVAPAGGHPASPQAGTPGTGGSSG